MKWISNKQGYPFFQILTDHTKIEPVAWGFELGDWFSFFSVFPRAGKNAKVEEESIDISETRIKCAYRIRLARGIYEVLTEDRIQGSSIFRKAELKTLESGLLGDFVIRLGLPAKKLSTGTIAAQCASHRESNEYLQHPTRSASFHYPVEGLVIESEIQTVSFPPGFLTCTYIRDEPPSQWILHHRLLAGYSQFQAWSFSRFRILLPPRFALWLGGITQRYWLRLERFGGKAFIPLQTGYLTRLTPGDNLSISVIHNVREA